MRMTLDVKYVPMSMDSSNDSTGAGIENLGAAVRSVGKKGGGEGGGAI